VAGTTYRGRESLEGETKAAAVTSRTVPITYLPRDPRIHCVGSPRQRLQSHQDATGAIAVVLPLGCLVGLGVVELCARRELRLARLGETVLGRVIEKGMHKEGARKVCRIRYQIDTPDGSARTGWAAVGPVLWESLHSGSPVTVVYDPDNPGHHRPTFSFRYVRFAPCGSSLGE
jgi:hypothetical protein